MTRVPRSPRSPRYVQVPGPKDMELGLPWPGGVTPLHRPIRDQKLDSLESVLNQTKEPHLALPFSPVSSTSPAPFPCEAPQNKTRQLLPDVSMCSMKLSDLQNEQHNLKVPSTAQISSGGWFDETNWMFKLAFDRFGALDTDELIRAYYAREACPEYGEDHVSTRGKRLVDTEEVEEFQSVYTCSRKKAVENHKIQERDRRDRHRVLQREVHNSTSTAVFAMTEEILPVIKETIKNMGKEAINPLQDRKGKKTGKDEQLTAAAIMPHLSNILIFRLFQAQNEAELRLQQLKNHFELEREARFKAEDQLSRLEQENKRLVDEVAQLRAQMCHDGFSRRSSAASFMTLENATPADGRKCPLSGLERPATLSSSSGKVDGVRGSKRPRIDELVQPPRFASRFRWPPSPSPDCDACQPYFCSCSHSL